MAEVPDRNAMDQIVRRLPTTSAKIRALAGAGFQRAIIARFLGIRYQHVRNVLVQSAEKSKAKPGPSSPVTARLGPEGRVVIPAEYRRALGLTEGAELVMSLDGDEVRLVSRDGAIRRVQAEISRHVPKTVSLADELIAERRREAEREDRNG